MHIPEESEIMFGITMVEPRERIIACPTSRTLQHQQSPQRHYHQVIKTTRVHHSSKNTRVVTVQEKVIRSRLQLGYSTPTNFINRYLIVFIIIDNTLTKYNYYLIN